MSDQKYLHTISSNSYTYIEESCMRASNVSYPDAQTMV